MLWQDYGGRIWVNLEWDTHSTQWHKCRHPHPSWHSITGCWGWVRPCPPLPQLNDAGNKPPTDFCTCPFHSLMLSYLCYENSTTDILYHCWCPSDLILSTVRVPGAQWSGSPVPSPSHRHIFQHRWAQHTSADIQWHGHWKCNIQWQAFRAFH